jgi:hypothetical protein
MRRIVNPGAARPLIQTASELICPHCQGTLHICQHRDRYIYRLDELVHQIRQDKRCPDQQCKGHGTLYRPLVDLRLALPRMSFGLDVVVKVGEGHLGQGRSLSELGQELRAKGVPIHQTHVGRVFRNFMALCKMTRGDEQKLRQRLIEQGGLVLMVDGVQFDNRSPVLYLCWDAISGSPLFGQRMQERDADGLGEMLQQVRRMGVPVLGIVTDAEKGLVPAVHKVFPEAPHHLCHTHFLKNCARPMESDLRQVGQSVAERAERVRKLEKRLDKSLESQPSLPGKPESQSLDCPSAPSEPAADGTMNTREPPVAPLDPSPQSPPAEPLTERDLVKQMCELARLDARVSGKAPLNPPELVRHQRLEELREVVQEAAKKKGHGHALA